MVKDDIIKDVNSLTIKKNPLLKNVKGLCEFPIIIEFVDGSYVSIDGFRYYQSKNKVLFGIQNITNEIDAIHDKYASYIVGPII